MTQRNRPTLTEGQLNAIAGYSSEQARLDVQIEEAQRRAEESHARARQALADIPRHGRILARLLFVPALVLAAALTYFVILGIGSGEIKEINKYGTAIVARATQPALYWASVIFHSMLCSFIWFVWHVTYKGSGWFRGSRKRTDE